MSVEKMSDVDILTRLSKSNNRAICTVKKWFRPVQFSIELICGQKICRPLFCSLIVVWGSCGMNCAFSNNQNSMTELLKCSVQMQF